MAGAAVLACDSLDRVAMQKGIHRLALPTPLGGSVNCYLIVDHPLTLVDTGPNWGGTLAALDRALRGLGYRLPDIDLLILTHQHAGHSGLAEIVADVAGADIACHERLAGWLARLPRSLEEDDAWTTERLAAHGVPRAEIEAHRACARFGRALAGRPVPTVVVRDGENLDLRDRTLRFELRPGHSPTDTVVADLTHDVRFTGDHLCGTAQLTPADGPGWRADLAPARRLRASLHTTACADPARLGLPGHGAPFPDVANRAETVLAGRRRHAACLLHRLGRPRTVHELRRPRRGVLDVLADLAILIDDGLAEPVDGPVPRFVATIADPNDT